MIYLKSVVLWFNQYNGELYPTKENGKPEIESAFHILDRDGRTYDYETFDNMLSEQDEKVVREYFENLN